MKPCPAQTILILRLNELSSEKAGLEEQLDMLKRRTINWKQAEKALDEFKQWCEEKRPLLATPEYEPSYAEKRDAIEKLGIRAIVYKKERRPRMDIELAPPDVMPSLCPDGVIYLTGRNLRS